MKAVAALAGMHRLVVVEGAAGAGKTATLAGARSILAQTGYGMVVVTPTLKAARVAEAEIGTKAYSAVSRTDRVRNPSIAIPAQPSPA